jgi:Zn finger protein HypA/HybF involved in hydrogenase expression
MLWELREMLEKLRAVEKWLKSRCECCGGAKSVKRSSWYCAKCDRKRQRLLKK